MVSHYFITAMIVGSVFSSTSILYAVASFFLALSGLRWASIPNHGHKFITSRITGMIVVGGVYFSIVLITYSLLGQVNGARPVDSVANFFGFHLFGITCLIIFFDGRRFDITRVLDSARPALIVAGLSGIIMYYRGDYINGGTDFTSVNDFRVGYQFAAFPVVGAAMAFAMQQYGTVGRRFFFKDLVLVVLFCSIAVLISFSKIVIGVGAMAIGLFLLTRINRYPIGMTILSAVLIAVIIKFDTLFLGFFASKEYILFTSGFNIFSDSIRVAQAGYLLNESSLLGQGLGSPLLSGYTRRTQSYGFELSYINLIHKFGFLIAITMIGFLCFLIFSRLPKQAGRNEKMRVSLGFFRYLVLGGLIGAGFNPILAHPTLVVLVTYLTFAVFFYRAGVGDVGCPVDLTTTEN